MRTKGAISTISYNSFNFLKMKLEELKDDGKISDWMFIEHEPEEDERKKHKHLFIQPNTLIDTLKLQRELIEPDPDHPARPLGCIDFHKSNSDDWILYNCHYRPYLISKGESRKFEYNMEDFCIADSLTFEYNWNHAFKASDWVKSFNVTRDLQSGLSPYELINVGRVPLGLANALIAYEKLGYRHTYRGGRSGHQKEDKQYTEHDIEIVYKN